MLVPETSRSEFTAPPGVDSDFLLYTALHAVHQIFPGTFRYVKEESPGGTYFTCWRVEPGGEIRPKSLSPEATREDLESYLEKTRLLREKSDGGLSHCQDHQSCG